MKRIGGGWQYTVYLKTPTRVLKKPRKLHEQIISITIGLLIGRAFSLEMLKTETARVQNAALISEAIINTLPSTIDLSIFGNPLYGSDGEYEQDRVDLLHTRLRSASTTEAWRLVDSYVALIEKMWEMGIAETSFNFSKNCGVDKDGSVIQIDLGELTDSKDVVANDIRNEIWKQRFSFSTLSPQLQAYFAETMRKRLTLEKLDFLWNRTRSG